MGEEELDITSIQNSENEQRNGVVAEGRMGLIFKLGQTLAYICIPMREGNAEIQQSASIAKATSWSRWEGIESSARVVVALWAIYYTNRKESEGRNADSSWGVDIRGAWVRSFLFHQFSQCHRKRGHQRWVWTGKKFERGKMSKSFKRLGSEWAREIGMLTGKWGYWVAPEGSWSWILKQDWLEGLCVCLWTHGAAWLEAWVW